MHKWYSVLTTIFWISLGTTAVSFWKRNAFNVEPPLERRLDQDPVQTKTTKTPFSVEQNEVRYEIEPLYDYDLTGLIVSYNHHNGNSSLHKRWNDHLNVADVCVVWKNNVTDLDLNKIKFWNGEFTCNFQTKDNATWQSFQGNQLSNNHLLATKIDLRKEIKKIKIGDQIRIRGWLSNYKEQGARGGRGTSITREDKGNGACETIYVDTFERLQPMKTGWRRTLGASTWALLVSGILWLIGVARGIF